MATLTLPPELLQKHVELFFYAEQGFREAFIAADPEVRTRRSLASVQTNGNAVRAAARLGWLDVAEEDVGEMHPGEVLRIAAELNEAIGAAYELSGE